MFFLDFFWGVDSISVGDTLIIINTNTNTSLATTTIIIEILVLSASHIGGDGEARVG